MRRYVGEAKPGEASKGKITGFNVMPGGPSGIPGSPGYATQLGHWLTADYHSVNMNDMIPSAEATREVLSPPE